MGYPIIVVTKSVQHSGENATEQNLITDPCSMNVDGMLPFENMVVIKYVKETGNHVQQENGSQEAVATQEYVLNTNAKKFHYPECRSVKQMNNKYRQAVTASRKEFIAQGYDLCGNCAP